MTINYRFVIPATEPEFSFFFLLAETGILLILILNYSCVISSDALLVGESNPQKSTSSFMVQASSLSSTIADAIMFYMGISIDDS